MPETYTKEQIHDIATALYGWTALPRILPSAPGTGHDWDIGADIRAILSALSTAEQERDALKAQVAELEAIPDRLRKLDISLCPEPHGEWSLLDGEKEIAFFGDSIESVIKQAEAAIVGKKEG